MERQHKTLLFILIFIMMSGCSDVSNNPTQSGEEQKKSYSNPIDEYFLPHIDDDVSEVERREYQDTYKGVWQSEFDNIMRWMYEKCKYQEDKDMLVAYEESVHRLIEATYDVVITDWLDNYDLHPDSPDRNSWGNGTRSGLNQLQAEIYRDAGMRLIDDEYSFLDVDYSKQHYE